MRRTVRFWRAGSIIPLSHACAQRLIGKRSRLPSHASNGWQKVAGYTWPDQPRLDTYRTLAEQFAACVGELNAIGPCLLGLLHEAGQFDPLRDIIAQAKQAA